MPKRTIDSVAEDTTDPWTTKVTTQPPSGDTNDNEPTPVSEGEVSVHRSSDGERVAYASFTTDLNARYAFFFFF